MNRLRGALLLVLLLGVAGMMLLGGKVLDTVSPGGSAASDALAAADSVAPLLTTPGPTGAAAATLERDIAAIYPGLRAGEAIVWSVSTCMAQQEGRDVIAHVRETFAGGTRPDPTPEQAQQIISAVERAGFCV